MNERTTLLTGGLLSLALVIGLLVPRPPGPAPAHSRPTSEDRGGLGLAGARAWLDARGVNTRSLRVRYAGLKDPETPATGNLLILHLPRLRAARPDELATLQAWLREGNTAIVLAAMAHHHAWLQEAEESLIAGSETLDLRFSDWPQPARDAADEPAASPARLDPIAAHPLTAGVESLATAASAGVLERPAREAEPWLALFGTAAGASIWWRRLGDGAMVVSAHADLFGNDPLREADNARFLANLVAVGTKRDGQVIFDDFHVGLSQLYDSRAFFADPRLHITLLFLLAFWLLYVVGRSNRLMPPRRTDTPTSTRAFAEAVGGLIRRRCTATTVGRDLVAHFRDEVRQRHGLAANGQPVWDRLRDHPGVPAAPLERLQSMARRLDAGHRVSLLRLTRDITRIQESLR